MNLNDYQLKRISELYLEDIPFILHPHWACFQLNANMALCNQAGRDYSNAFDVHEVSISSIKSGTHVYVTSFTKGYEFQGVLNPNGSLMSGLPLFLQCYLDGVLKHQISRPMPGYSRSGPAKKHAEIQDNSITKGILAAGEFVYNMSPLSTAVDVISGTVDTLSAVAAGNFKDAAMIALETAADIPGKKFKAIGKLGNTIVEGEGKNFAGKQNKNQRLKSLLNDNKVSSANKGWIKQEMNEVAAGKKGHLRNPPGKDLAHERGRENAKGYGYEHAHLQNRKDHRSQHKLDNWGKKNKERSVP